MEDISTNAIDEKKAGNKIALNYGAIIALITIVIGLVVYLLGFDQFNPENRSISWIVSIFTYGIMIGGMYMAVVKYRDEVKGGYVSLGEAFVFGIKVILVFSVISAIWLYIFLAFINPNYLETMRSTMEEAWTKQGMDDQQIEDAWGMTAKFMKPGMMAVFSIGSFLFIGAIIDLIIAAIVKKERQQPNW